LDNPIQVIWSSIHLLNYHKGLPLFGNQNYSFVLVDWRGFFGSSAYPGIFTQHILNSHTSANASASGRDGYDIVEWIAAQPWYLIN
jgi:predicted acyl esterase